MHNKAHKRQIPVFREDIIHDVQTIRDTLTILHKKINLAPSIFHHISRREVLVIGNRLHNNILSVRRDMQKLIEIFKTSAHHSPGVRESEVEAVIGKLESYYEEMKTLDNRALSLQEEWKMYHCSSRV